MTPTGGPCHYRPMSVDATAAVQVAITLFGGCALWYALGSKGTKRSRSVAGVVGGLALGSLLALGYCTLKVMPP